VNRDPIGYDGGTLNLYEYVNGMPLVGLDPYGLQLQIPDCCTVEKIKSDAAGYKKCFQDALDDRIGKIRVATNTERIQTKMNNNAYSRAKANCRKVCGGYFYQECVFLCDKSAGVWYFATKGAILLEYRVAVSAAELQFFRDLKNCKGKFTCATYSPMLP